MNPLRVAVVGAGIHGLSASWALVQRGHAVTLYDRHQPGHTQGSSHGRSRIVRRAYSDPFYTECMLKAYPLWEKLEANSASKLLHEVGLIYFGRQDSPDVESVIEGLRTHGVLHEVLDSRGVRNHLESLQLGSNEIGVYTPGAGWVDAEATLRATFQLATSAGCQFVPTVATPDQLTKFDKVVVCAGAWVKEWWPDAPVTVSLQTNAYVSSQQTGPVWIEDGEDLVYGFPSEHQGFKVGVHRAGPIIDPNTLAREPHLAHLDRISKLASQRFGIESPELVDSFACLYTNTADEDFLLRQIDPRTHLVSACSGHAFKFGPWIGELMADWVEGRTEQHAHVFARFERP